VKLSQIRIPRIYSRNNKRHKYSLLTRRRQLAALWSAGFFANNGKASPISQLFAEFLAVMGAKNPNLSLLTVHAGRQGWDLQLNDARQLFGPVRQMLLHRGELSDLFFFQEVFSRIFQEVFSRFSFHRNLDCGAVDYRDDDDFPQKNRTNKLQGVY
jgi:hypothetical protein